MQKRVSRKGWFLRRMLIGEEAAEEQPKGGISNERYFYEAAA